MKCRALMILAIAASLATPVHGIREDMTERALRGLKGDGSAIEERDVLSEVRTALRNRAEDLRLRMPERPRAVSAG
jgi:hypothetical protein